MRMVRPRKLEEVDTRAAAAFNDVLPTTVSEIAKEHELYMRFDEVDLKTCDGAVAKLLRFPELGGEAFWSERTLVWMRNSAPGFRNRL